MDLLEVANRRSVPGILIFNHRQEPIFFNPVALGILSKINGSHPDSSHPMMGVTIPKEIFNLYENLKKSYLADRGEHPSPIGPQISLFSTQDAMYCCRGFPLNADTDQSGHAFHIMMLIEKVSQHRQIDLEKLRNRFQLTNRQMEIIKHLFSGLTNKRIADALCVSEDTIKGHLKHIMRRLKVNSRTEILAIILQL